MRHHTAGCQARLKRLSLCRSCRDEQRQRSSSTPALPASQRGQPGAIERWRHDGQRSSRNLGGAGGVTLADDVAQRQRADGIRIDKRA
jgi:hypothetical protein